MNNLKTFAACFIMSLFAATTMAQNAVEQAIKDFVDGAKYGKYLTANNYQEDQDADSLPLSFYREYKFNVAKHNKQFEKLREAFDESKCNYYMKKMKEAGEEPYATWSVGYGAHSENSVQFGTHKSHNYSLIYVRDKQHPKWRTVYALVWFDDKKDADNYKGSLHIIYSPDPKKMVRTRVMTSKEWDDYNRQMEEYKRQMEDYNQEMEAFSDRINGYDYPQFYADSLFNGSKTYGYVTNEKITTAEQFMSRFGTLRALYFNAVRHQRSTSYKTSLLNNIVSLCKNKAKLLSVDEKDVCTCGIKEMEEQTWSDYDKKLLNIARKALK